jgi:hypothetical protein
LGNWGVAYLPPPATRILVILERWGSARRLENIARLA